MIKNCVEHCRQGGTVTFVCQENLIYTAMIIEDDGPGLIDNRLHHLFDRFYQGENRFKDSYGIGLSLSSMILSRHKGVITTANRPYVGEQFTIQFYKSKC